MKNVCPRCSAAMGKEKIFIKELNMSVIGCKNCGGFLADYDQSESIMQSMDRNTLENSDKELSPDADKELLGTCPLCDSEFHHMQLDFEVSGGKVELDQCSGCQGIWFDKGELKEIFALAIKEANMMGEMGDKIDKTNGKTVHLQCPRCNAETEAIQTEVMGFDLIKCKTCQGLWVTGSQTDVMLDAARHSKVKNEELKSDDKGAQELKGTCPECKIPLKPWENKPEKVKDLQIDYCEKCHGLWFDEGEFSSFFKIFAESPFQQ